jgi:catechol 2,3-dioxygenase-like lactoylglutathione lyase family enzyme
MKVVNKIMMLAMVVSDMPKAKEFYADKLGLKVTKDYRQDDDHWWVSVTFPEGGASITLTTYKENAKPGMMTLWFETSDIAEAHKELEDKGVKVNDVKDDLYGPGSGVKWFNLNDPDGNLVHVVQGK